MRSLTHSHTHRESGDGGDQRVHQYGGDLAAVLRSGVGLGEGLVVAEEALDVHGEGVRVLKVVRQENGAGHDHQLEIEHDPVVRREKARERENRREWG